MSKIIILYTLKPGVTHDQYENWVRTTDYPVMRGVKRVLSYTNHRVVRNLLNDATPRVEYIEVFDIADLDGFVGEDMPGSVVQKILGAFMQYVENPEFLVAEEIV